MSSCRCTWRTLLTAGLLAAPASKPAVNYMLIQFEVPFHFPDSEPLLTFFVNYYLIKSISSCRCTWRTLLTAGLLAAPASCTSLAWQSSGPTVPPPTARSPLAAWESLAQFVWKRLIRPEIFIGTLTISILTSSLKSGCCATSVTSSFPSGILLSNTKHTFILMNSPNKDLA